MAAMTSRENQESERILGLQAFPRDRKDKNMAAMLVP
jgi:hypothetical protein